jgi:hypothetical protein
MLCHLSHIANLRIANSPSMAMRESGVDTHHVSLRQFTSPIAIAISIAFASHIFWYTPPLGCRSTG